MTLVAEVGMLSATELREIYHHMVMTRVLHERMTNLQRQGRIGSWLGSLGQEAATVASAYALEPQDWLFPSYREHGAALARGIPVRALVDHLFGNAADHVRGRNLPPEYSFREVNFVSVSAPVGTQVPQAVGAAWAARLKRDPVVSITYFGDGTASEGDVHVAMNFAGVYRAPVIFFCQHNGWAISVPSERQTAAPGIAERAVAYGIRGVRIDGNDPVAVYQATREAADRARAGEGATLIEARTYRLGPHSTSDDPSVYRDAAEVEAWKANDPIERARQRLEALGAWEEGLDVAAFEAAQQAITDAIREAEQVPPPDLSSMFAEVYAEVPPHLREQAGTIGV